MIPRLRGILGQRGVPDLPRCRADDWLERQISKRRVRCRHAILSSQLFAALRDRTLVRCVHGEEVSHPAQHEDDESDDENGSE
jgi:hypothetical protein